MSCISSTPLFQDIDERELEQEIEQMAFVQMQDSMDLEYRDDGYLQLVLKILGLMCDGQNKTLQDYLREQPDNIKSVNLVAETARFLALVYSSINKNTMAVVTELFQALVEFTGVSVGSCLRSCKHVHVHTCTCMYMYVF